jgi:hypothetical protein
MIRQRHSYTKPATSRLLDDGLRRIAAIRRKLVDDAELEGKRIASHGLPAALCIEHDPRLKQAWLEGWQQERERLARRWDDLLTEQEAQEAGE